MQTTVTGQCIARALGLMTYCRSRGAHGARRRVTVGHGGRFVCVLLYSGVLQAQSYHGSPNVSSCDECFCGAHCVELRGVNLAYTPCQDRRLHLIAKYNPDLSCQNTFLEDQKLNAIAKCGLNFNPQHQCNYIGGANLREVHFSLLLLIPSTIVAFKTWSE